MFFDKDTIGIVKVFCGIAAIVDSIICLFTIATYFVDSSRFSYPAMAIVHMAVCYTVVSLIYVIGLVMNDNIACGNEFKFEDTNLGRTFFSIKYILYLILR